MAVRHRPPTYVFANFSAGGVPAGITEGIFASHIEKITGLPVSSLIDGCNSASAGTSIAAPLFTANAENPLLPRYTAEETLELFKDNAKVWLKRPIPYIRQHVRQSLQSLRIPFMRSAAADAIYLDEKIVERTLDQYLGNVTLQDLKRTFMISAHNVSARPQDEALQLGKIIDAQGRAVYTPSPTTRISDLMRGSMAVPGHFKSKFIEGVGNISDFGHIYDAQNALATFMETLPPDARTIFIEFGGPRQYGHHSAEQLDNCSLLSLILNAHLVRGTSNHSYSVGMKTNQHMLRGRGEIYDLTPIINVREETTVARPSENILDASLKSIQKSEDFAYSHLEKRSEEIARLCDFLAENYYERTKVLASAAYSIKKDRPKLPGLFSWLNAKPKQALVSVAPA